MHGFSLAICKNNKGNLRVFTSVFIKSFYTTKKAILSTLTIHFTIHHIPQFLFYHTTH